MARTQPYSETEIAAMLEALLAEGVHEDTAWRIIFGRVEAVQEARVYARDY